MGQSSGSHAERAQKVSNPLEKRGGGGARVVFKGGGGGDSAKCFGPTDFPFCSPPPCNY